MNSKRIQADELILGSEHKEHFTLSSDGFALYQDRHTMRAWLTQREGNPRLYLLDKNRQVRVELGVYGDGTPSVSVKDGNGTERMNAYLLESGLPTFEILDGTRTKRMEVSLQDDDNDPRLTFYDKAGSRMLDLYFDNGAPTVLVADKETGRMVQWLKAKDKEA